MSLHADLLRQAQYLANREPVRPRQASLRRAISTAYYALFHLLIREATTRLIAIGTLRDRFARGFNHREMKEISQSFANRLTTLTGGLPIPRDLQDVAATFVELQEARHEADYNVGRHFTRHESNQLVAKVQQAFHDWQSIRTDPVAHMYLAALLLGRKKWHR